MTNEDRTVQVPVSLIQDVLLALRENTPQSTRVARGMALHALLSQPTNPTRMEQGTTFVYLSGLWEVVDGGDALLRNGPGKGITYRTLSQFDPSTIRDVTPPKEQP